MPTTKHRQRRLIARPRHRQQQGVALLIALITVVMLFLASIATLKSIDSSLLVSGNVAFKEAAVQSSEYGTEAARAFLLAVTASTTLSTDSAASGYYASWHDEFNPRTFTWDNTTSALVSGTPSGYEVRYVIHRMCGNVGAYNLTATNCYVSQSTAGSNGSSQSSFAYGGLQPGSNIGSPYYRITTRTVGPRNTTAYIQAVMY